MRLDEIILRIRYMKTSFGNFVGGAAELNLAIKNTLKKDMAFVIPLPDECPRNQFDNCAIQSITEKFGVVIALANDESQKEKLGIIPCNRIHDIRNEFFRALVSWTPKDASSLVCYRGSKLIDINNAYMWYQFDFEYQSRLVQDMLEESDYDDTEIPVDFNTIYMQIINTPDERIPYEGDLPYPDNFPNVRLPNMANWIDLTVNPDAGAFGKGFAAGYDIYHY